MPIPSFFRMYFEKRAYISSLYVIYKLSKKLNFDPSLKIHRDYFVDQFKGSYYYFMWPFKNIEKDFDEAIVKICNDERPFQDTAFDMLDDLIF
jgi:hypothetical protein